MRKTEPETGGRPTPRPRTPRFVFATVAVIAGAAIPAPAAALSTSDTASAAANEGGYDMHTSGVPRVEEGTCPDGVPTGNRVQCLTLVVPESRGLAAVESDRLVRLPVVIVAARQASPRADPLLWVDYSAGDGFVVGRARIFTDNVLSLNENRDVITLDLRGSGLAEPSLACPEVTELNVEWAAADPTIGPFIADVDETSPEGRRMRLDAIQRCHDRLINDGVNLSAFGADDAAQDLEDLRIALGLEQWNIVAGEYGSKLAQILARDHPEGVRSVLVNATPVPLQADWFADLAPNAARAWSALVAACEADAGCAQAFPDLGERFESYVADLTTNPRSHDEVQLDWDARAPFLMTSSRLLSYVRSYGRDNRFLAEVPFSIAGPSGDTAEVLQTFDPDAPDTLRYQASDAYAAPAWGVWELFPHDTTNDVGSYALGAHLSAVCRDEAPFTDPARLAEASAVPMFGPFLGNHADLDACPIWDVQPASAAANEAATSDVPFLVLAGEFMTPSRRRRGPTPSPKAPTPPSPTSPAPARNRPPGPRRPRRPVADNFAMTFSTTPPRSWTTAASPPPEVSHSASRRDPTRGGPSVWSPILEPGEGARRRSRRRPTSVVHPHHLLWTGSGRYASGDGSRCHDPAERPCRVGVLRRL